MCLKNDQAWHVCRETKSSVSMLWVEINCCVFCKIISAGHTRVLLYNSFNGIACCDRKEYNDLKIVFGN